MFDDFDTQTQSDEFIPEDYEENPLKDEDPKEKEIIYNSHPTPFWKTK